MEKRIAISLASTLVLLLAWRFFNLFLSIDKVDWFLFYPLEQEPWWYVYNSSKYAITIVHLHIIHFLVSKHYPKVKSLSLIILVFAYLRTIMYWLFRGSLNLEFSIACIVIFTALLIVRWQRF